ncbi:MAG: ABC transporter permease [Candidatus Nanopelagicales bacterium]
MTTASPAGASESTHEAVPQSLWAARAHLIWTFAIRDLRARFTVTSLGWVWTLIVPLATVLIYSVVFGVIFRAQAPAMGNGRAGLFAPWFFVGLVSWNVFLHASNGGMSAILGMGPMMQKVFIPSYVPAIAASLSVTIERVLEATVMLAVLLFFGNVGWTWLLYPLVFLILAIFATALGYILGVANIFFRDTVQIFGIVTQLWFFLTPIMYTVDMIPEDWNGIPVRSLLAVNPMADFVEIGRDLLYGLRLPGLGEVVYVLAWTLVLALSAVGVYRRWGRDVAEAI